MTRRGFFCLLGLAAVTAPATATLLPEKLATVGAWWSPVGWYEKLFDRGFAYGIAGSFRNRLTGETIRNAVRMPLPGGPTPNTVNAAQRRGESWLMEWAADLPAWRLPVRPGHGHFDDVLEGHERVLDSLGLLGERVA